MEYIALKPLLSTGAISNGIHLKVWDENIYALPNLYGCTVEVWEWMNNWIRHFTGFVITYPFWD